MVDFSSSLNSISPYEQDYRTTLEGLRGMSYEGIGPSGMDTLKTRIGQQTSATLRSRLGSLLSRLGGDSSSPLYGIMADRLTSGANSEAISRMADINVGEADKKTAFDLSKAGLLSNMAGIGASLNLQSSTLAGILASLQEKAREFDVGQSNWTKTFGATYGSDPTGNAQRLANQNYRAGQLGLQEMLNNIGRRNASSKLDEILKRAQVYQQVSMLGNPPVSWPW